MSDKQPDAERADEDAEATQAAAEVRRVTLAALDVLRHTTVKILQQDDIASADAPTVYMGVRTAFRTMQTFLRSSFEGSLMPSYSDENRRKLMDALDAEVVRISDHLAEGMIAQAKENGA